MMEKENLQNQLERTSFSHAEEKVKLESTLAQQTKLIDFLQKKVMVDDRNFASAPKKKDKVFLNISMQAWVSDLQWDQKFLPPNAWVIRVLHWVFSLKKAKNINDLAKVRIIWGCE